MDMPLNEMSPLFSEVSRHDHLPMDIMRAEAQQLHMMWMEYTDLAERLSPEAIQLFSEMALAHLEVGSGDHSFIRSDTSAGTRLQFLGPGVSKSWRNLDGGAIEDLITYGLLHVNYSSRGTPSYRISGEGLRFYRWLMDQKSMPVTQVEQVVRSTVDGADFAVGHPGAAHHLAEAFALLWSDNTTPQVIAEIGEHLRGAIIDMANDVAPDEGSPEKPTVRLRSYLQRLSGTLGEREVAVLERLVDLVDATLRLDQRLTHIRDETGKNRPLRSWDEARRAAFLTGFACYELHKALAP